MIAMKDKIRGARAAVARARGFLERWKVEQAEEAATRAVGALEHEGALPALIEALTLLGAARARSLQAERARESLRWALVLADRAGEHRPAGRAALSYLEELSAQVSTVEACDIYLNAYRLLASSRHRETLVRLRRRVAAVIEAAGKEMRAKQAPGSPSFGGAHCLPIISDGGSKVL
jgi:hypothetical protein